MKRRRVSAWLLLALAALGIALGEWGLYGVKPLIEYAAPYAPPVHTKEGDWQIPLLSALDALEQQFPGASLSAFVQKQTAQVEELSGRSASCSVTGVAPGWFDLYHRTLISGRILGEEEIQDGKPVAVVNTALAYALWGERDVAGYTITLNGAEMQVVGSVDHQGKPGQVNQLELYIPLPTALKLGLPADIQVLSGVNLAQRLFETRASAFVPGGRCYSLAQERMGAGLSFRYLCVLMMWIALGRLLSVINRFSRFSMGKWRARSARVYGGRMVIPTLLLGLQWLLCYGAWLAAVYMTLQVAVAPVQLFSEWIPEDLAHLSSYRKVLARAVQDRLCLMTTATESVLRVRFCGAFIQGGCVLMLLGAALYGRRRSAPAE